METPLYAIRSLAHVYRGKPVLSIDRLNLPRGGIIGVIGPNGSGKSTFLRLAGFVEKPTAGEVLFDGKPAGPFAPEVRNRVTLLPQEPFLMKRTVLNNVAYGLRIRKTNDHLAERVDKALSYVGLDAKVSITPGLTLDLTWNTDFAQVESDNVQVNLTRYDLFFPEKR